jgi:hypothetical protein
LVHAKQENEIVGVKDVPDSIYDPKKLYVEHFIKPRKRMKRVSSSSRINPEEDDPDLKSFLENGRQLTNYYSSAD